VLETPKPTLARFLEAIAGILDLRDGRLELISLAIGAAAFCAARLGGVRFKRYEEARGL